MSRDSVRDAITAGLLLILALTAYVCFFNSAVQQGRIDGLRWRLEMTQQRLETTEQRLEQRLDRLADKFSDYRWSEAEKGRGVP